jgi:hypothetical protein
MYGLSRTLLYAVINVDFLVPGVNPILPYYLPGHLEKLIWYQTEHLKYANAYRSPPAEQDEKRLGVTVQLVKCNYEVARAEKSEG